MGERWSRPRHQVHTPPSEERRRDSSGDSGEETSSDWSRVRRAWQRRDEALRLGGRLGRAAERGARKAASVKARTRRTRWERVGSGWERVDLHPDPTEQEVAPGAPESAPWLRWPGRASPEADGDLGDKRDLWEECARRGQQWASRRAQVQTSRSSVGAEEDEDAPLLPSKSSRRGRFRSAPPTPTRSPTRSRVRAQSTSSAHEQLHPDDFGGSVGSIHAVRPVRGASGLTWGSWSSGSWSSADTSRREQDLHDSCSEGDEGDRDREHDHFAWKEFRVGMTAMVRRLDGR